MRLEARRLGLGSEAADYPLAGVTFRPDVNFPFVTFFADRHTYPLSIPEIRFKLATLSSGHSENVSHI
ncbi:hypothetical protein [Marinobacterium aestuariivivens]|uniref:hypothetical protein n=1 Tax=Marinobacterium aestuariivivens TaxID=1698799 RepID=UPI0036D29A8B